VAWVEANVVTNCSEYWDQYRAHTVRMSGCVPSPIHSTVHV